MTLITKLYGNSPRLQFINPVLVNNSKLASDIWFESFLAVQLQTRREKHISPREHLVYPNRSICVFILDQVS